jgi:CHAD domain-containing protein
LIWSDGMAFQLKKGEPAGKGTRRLVRRQIARALEALGRDGDSDDHVHEARKRFKRIRAVLRLVRDELGEKTYRRANRCFRDAARPLTEVRDAKVLIETADKLGNENISQRTLARLRAQLRDQREATRRRILHEQDALARVAKAVAACARLTERTSSHKSWPGLRNGLKRVYKQGRDALATANAGDPTVTSLHEWRKQAKYLWHQLQLLQPIRPQVMRGLADRVHELTTVLGDDHDLAVLRAQITADAGGDGVDVKKLLAVIDRRRQELQSKAFQLGRRIYRDKPKCFLDRIKSYWKAWET